MSSIATPLVQSDLKNEMNFCECTRPHWVQLVLLITCSSFISKP